MVKQKNSMKALIVTNEFPPDVYGGAGVHVDYLTRELRKLIQVEVRCFGSQRANDKDLDVHGFDIDRTLFTSCPKELEPALSACYRSIGFTAKKIDAHVIHCHTWYTHLSGILAKYCYGIPLIITIHSLEPLRPWKREQLGRGYDLSCWIEKTAIEMADAVIAVSEGTKQDVLNNFDVEENKIHVIYNGIDTNEYSYVDSQDALDKYGVDKNRPYVLFVGRITRQKGILHLVNAIPFIDPNIQIVLCAGSPDTKEIAEEMKSIIAKVSESRGSVFWIQEMVDKKSLIGLYSHAASFCCPSIYEPFGIINLEAMACETPVVASSVGGIKEVVVSGETGILVEFEKKGKGSLEPDNPNKFSKDLADAINRLVTDTQMAQTMGKKGRKRAEDIFSWKSIAEKTVGLYKALLNSEIQIHMECNTYKEKKAYEG